MIVALNFDSVQNSSRKIKSFGINFIDSGLGFTTLEDGLSFNGRALPNIAENFTFYWIQWDKTNNVCIKLYFFLVYLRMVLLLTDFPASYWLFLYVPKYIFSRTIIVKPSHNFLISQKKRDLLNNYRDDVISDCVLSLAKVQSWNVPL